MTQSVRMGLVFPRSGQQLFVLVSPQVVSDLDPAPYEHEGRPTEVNASGSAAHRSEDTLHIHTFLRP